MTPENITRRDFLKTSVAGLCAICLAGCGFSIDSSPEEYWAKNKDLLMKEYRKMTNSAAKYIREKVSPEETEAIIAETRKNYDQLLPQVPYIGGDRNQLTETLYKSAVALALYQAMKAHGQDVEETGRVMYRVMEDEFNFNEPLAGAYSRNPTGKVEQENFRVMERWSQKSTYPGDWKLKFIEGDGANFDFGVDYTECGIVKFFKAHDAFELVRYICLGDFPISRGIGSGLVRTTTLGSGGPRCDFRFKAGRPIQMEWTPDFLK